LGQNNNKLQIQASFSFLGNCAQAKFDAMKAVKTWKTVWNQKCCRLWIWVIFWLEYLWTWIYTSAVTFFSLSQIHKAKFSII